MNGSPLVVASFLVVAAASTGAAAQNGIEGATGPPAYSRGLDSAPIEIVEFCDFSSEACGDLAVVLRVLLEERPADVKLVFRHNPAADDDQAWLAHEAALAAGQQGKFWEMHDLLYANQDRLERTHLLGMAGQAGLDVGQFTEDVDGRRYRAAVSGERSAAARAGVQSNPAVFVNGRPLPSVPSLGDLRAAVERELKALSR